MLGFFFSLEALEAGIIGAVVSTAYMSWYRKKHDETDPDTEVNNLKAISKLIVGCMLFLAILVMIYDPFKWF